MSSNKRDAPKFAVGALVRVKKGVVSPHYADLPFGGWRGKVYQINGTLCLVHWSATTLKAVSPVYRDRCKRDGVDFRVMWLPEDVLEADPGGPLCIE